MRVGVVIGRFQVPMLHPGHQHLMDHVVANSDRVVVFIGVSHVDGHTAENPLTYSQRQTVFHASKYADAVIMPLFDMVDNKSWSNQIDVILGNLYPHDSVVLYGGRDSFTQSYLGKLPVTVVPIDHSLGLIQGRDVREGIMESFSTDFLRGQIFALGRQFPKVHSTVDIAALANGGESVLLIQRKDTSEWVFPGGFVDPTDDSKELAAARELNEEVGLSCSSGALQAMEYIGTQRIDDWRYRASRDKILTTFFACYPMTQAVHANPEEVQDYKWVNIWSPDTWKEVAQHHKPLMQMLVDYQKSQHNSNWRK